MLIQITLQLIKLNCSFDSVQFEVYLKKNQYKITKDACFNLKNILKNINCDTKLYQC